MADIIFEITTRSGLQADGRLKWPDKGLDSAAVSGPFGRGSLPNGLYRASRGQLLDRPADSPYCDPGNRCWMQVTIPNFSTDRTDLGIHPDGNVPGTEGCIGIKDNDTRPWYDAFYSVPRSGSVSVEVKDVGFAPQYVYDVATYSKRIVELGDRVSRLETQLCYLKQSDEQLKWALVSSLADEAFYFANNWLDLRDEDGDVIGESAIDRLGCIIRAVSWVESKHGTIGPSEPARDPMQCGNPNDLWWKTITRQLGNGDRFVRGPNYTGAEGAYWAGELAGIYDAEAPANAKVSSLGAVAEQQEGHRDADFNLRLSYFWGVLYLIHRTNTHPDLGSAARSYKCGNSSMDRLIKGAIQYNGGGDPDYGDKIREALLLIGCT